MCGLFYSHDPEAELLPPVELVSTVFPMIAGAEVAAQFAAKRVAGDFYDSIRTGPERVLIALLDVGGRREENLSVLTAAQQIFRESGSQIFSPLDLNESVALTELSLRINRGLIEASSGVRSCRAFLACYHENLGTLCYTNAGDNPALLRDRTGITELAPTGLSLGLFSHATVDAPTIGMEKGSCLLLVSPGVVEAEPSTADDGRPGLDRIKQLFQKTPPTSPRDLCASILGSESSNGNALSSHDRTVLALLRTD